MIRKTLVLLSLLIMAGCASAEQALPEFSSVISETDEPMQTGKFGPTWESLKNYDVPEWFRDAKFGIWAHWGPQCAPEHGDWYARHMYMQNGPDWAGDTYAFHREHYGHPSEFGFKDVIYTWKAEKWNPEKLVALYKRVGAQYFVAMASHHDNFDNWDSKYQPWNSVNVGPKKDLIAGWAKAAHNNGLRFGVSVHASHAWSWYEPAQGADESGDYAGVPYDGKLTKADGEGKWWEGLDPQDLYAQNHVLGKKLQWEWDVAKGSSVPDAAYCEKFYNRTLDLLNKYQPDLVYFDDTALPLYPISNAGLKIAAHYYNSSMKWHNGRLEGVLTGKKLNPEQRQCIVRDIERGRSGQIEPQPWQTCTCIGSWHYDRRIYKQHRYKDAKTVIQMLIDIVSKNGNMLLSIPLRSDGSLDSDEEQILENIAVWMKVNKESIIGSRPWEVFGEGPAVEAAAPLEDQGFNGEKGKPFTAEDVRYTMSKDGKTLYVFFMGRPDRSDLILQSLRVKPYKQATISLLGYRDEVFWQADKQGRLTIETPDPWETRIIDDYAIVFKLEGFDFTCNK